MKCFQVSAEDSFLKSLADKIAEKNELLFLANHIELNSLVIYFNKQFSARLTYAGVFD